MFHSTRSNLVQTIQRSSTRIGTFIPVDSTLCRCLVRFSSSVEKNESQDSDADWIKVQVETDINERIVPLPANILPDHLPQTRKRMVQKPWWKYKYFVKMNALPLEESEYTDEPQYPPIYDPSPEGFKKQIRTEWYKAIRNLPTAEQKIYEITKHYGHFSYFVEPVMRQHNLLPIQQQITRTRLVNHLPEHYFQTAHSSTQPVDSVLKQSILSFVSSRLGQTKSRKAGLEYKKSFRSQLGWTSQEDQYIRTTKEEDILVDTVQLIQNFYQNSGDNESNNLNNTFHYDYNPFVGTSWWVNDYPIPFHKKKWFKNETMNQLFLYRGNHGLHVRNEHPLPPIIALDDELSRNEDETVPTTAYNLLQLSVPLRRYNILSLPGFWPDHSGGFDFPFLLGHTYDALRLRKNLDWNQEINDDVDVLNGMAIMSAFSWLTSLANNLGFSLYDPLTYPLVTQVIITDGQYWSFFLYQLNNHCFHSDIYGSTNQKLISPVNVCWSSGPKKLFDSIETNGELSNVDEEVLNLLVKFVTMKPSVVSDVQNLRPYLGVDTRTPEEKAELNYSLRRKFANQINSYVARRKKTNLWETIYKNHKDAPLDVKRTRPKLDFKYPPFFTS